MKKKLNVKEVAQILHEEDSTIRFWEKEFAEYLQVKTERGRRERFTPENLEMFTKIHELLHTEMYTIKGAKRRLELDRAVGDSMGIEHNFKTTVLFMFSSILTELQEARKETSRMAEKLRQLEEINNLMEKKLWDAHNKGILKLFRRGMLFSREG